MDLQKTREKLKEYRNRIGISQEDLADGIYVNKGVFSDILNGKRALTSDLVHRILLYLAEHGAIRGQSQVYEFLELTDSEEFSEADWKAPPLADLRPAPSPTADSYRPSQQEMHLETSNEEVSSPVEALTSDLDINIKKRTTLASNSEASKHDFKLYRGWRIHKRPGKGTVTRFPYVTVNGRPLRYFGPFKRDPEQNRLFEWGFSGSGPSQLAQSILADFFEEVYPEKGYASRKDFHALIYRDAFKHEVIAAFPRGDDDDWELSSFQIRSWLLSLEERGITEKDLLEKTFVYDDKTGQMKIDEEIS